VNYDRPLEKGEAVLDCCTVPTVNHIERSLALADLRLPAAFFERSDEP